MASVNRIIPLTENVSAGATNEPVETVSPAQNEQITTVGLGTNANTNIDYTLLLNETTLVDAVPGDDLPTLDNPIRFEVKLGPGDELQFQATNNDTANAQQANLHLMVEDTALPG